MAEFSNTSLNTAKASLQTFAKASSKRVLENKSIEDLKAGQSDISGVLFQGQSDAEPSDPNALHQQSLHLFNKFNTKVSGKGVFAASVLSSQPTQNPLTLSTAKPSGDPINITTAIMAGGVMFSVPVATVCNFILSMPPASILYSTLGAGLLGGVVAVLGVVCLAATQKSTAK